MKRFVTKTGFVMALLAVLVLASCGKKNSGIPGLTQKKAKLVFTIDNTFLKSEGDYFDVTVSGANSGSYIAWKVNGVKQTGVNVTVGTDDFNGGNTITLESDGTYDWGQVSFSGFEMGNTPFTVKWKIEVDNVTKDEGEQLINKNRDPLFSKSLQL